ncbi:flippase [Candidatus Woesearchaeota archaeon]|nr:flippase [Candidatus Woesearchaeota archaeon]
MKPSSKKSDGIRFGTARRITANFASLLTAEIISRILQFVIFVYLARSLGKDNFGIFSFGLAFGLIVMVIVDFGLNQLFVREISRNKALASKYLFNGIIIKIFLAGFAMIIAYLFLNIMDYPSQVKIVAYIMLLFALVQSFNELCFSVFRAFERMHYEMGIKILRMLVLISSVFYLVKNNYGLAVSVWAFPAAEFIVLSIATVIVYARFAKISFEFDYGFSKMIVKESSLFFFSAIFTTLYLYADQIMISKLRSTTEVGIYSAAANITIALIFIPLMYANSIYPVISRFYINSKKSLKLVYERSFKYMLVLGLPIAAGIYVLSDKIILFLYGEEYSASAAVLSMLSGYILLKFLNPVTGYTLMAINKQGTRLLGQASAAAINIVLNFVLIPIYGIIGAAAATLITEIIFFIIYSGFAANYGFNLRFLIMFVHKPLIAAGTMVFLLQFIGNLFIAVFAGFLIYISILLFLKIMDNEDKRIFYKIINNL